MTLREFIDTVLLPRFDGDTIPVSQEEYDAYYAFLTPIEIHAPLVFRGKALKIHDTTI